jgi:hypothetical protein
MAPEVGISAPEKQSAPAVNRGRLVAIVHRHRQASQGPSMTALSNSTNWRGFPALACGGFPPTQGDEAMSKLSRRTLVAGAATLPALAAPAFSAQPDPALALAAQCRHLYAEFGATNLRQPPFRSAEWEADEATACDAWYASFETMVATQPKTSAGAVAMLDAALESDGEHLDMAEPGIATLLRSLRQFLRAAS